jgi:hypothetical protein
MPKPGYKGQRRLWWRHGKGRMVFEDGRIFDGEWKVLLLLVLQCVTRLASSDAPPFMTHCDMNDCLMETAREQWQC